MKNQLLNLQPIYLILTAKLIKPNFIKHLTSMVLSSGNF